MTTVNPAQAQANGVLPVDQVQQEALKRRQEADADRKTEREGLAQSPDRKPEDVAANEEFVQRLLGADRKLAIQARDQGGFIYQIVAKETGEIVKQFPAEEFLRFADAQREFANRRLEAPEGLLVNRRA